tara:strand:+ start:9217 stop:9681 length:465 start_codon:yes stop_codon:yes gene_type:complete
MSKNKQSAIETINAFIVANPNAYVARMELQPTKAFVRNGVAGTAPYYGNPMKAKSTISLGGLSLIDTASVYIPNAPKSTGTPAPGWWLDSTVDTSLLPSVIYRVVIAESAEKHVFAKHLPNNGVILHDDIDGLNDTSSARTWSEAIDSLGGVAV